MSAGLRAAVEALANEWQAELNSGAIRDRDARYCWSTAAREVRRVLATHPTPDQQQNRRRSGLTKAEGRTLVERLEFAHLDGSATAERIVMELVPQINRMVTTPDQQPTAGRIAGVLAEHVRAGGGGCSCGDRSPRGIDYAEAHRTHVAQAIAAALGGESA